jgi:hypothetical protein
MSEEIPPLAEVISLVDYAVMDQIKHEPTGLVLGLYLYFDSPWKPLTGREFLEFWSSLRIEEKIYYINAKSRLPMPAKNPLTSEEWEMLYDVCRSVFESRGLAWWERKVD